MSAYAHEPSTEAVLVGSDRHGREEAEMCALGFLARYRVEHTRYTYGVALKQWFGWCAEHFVDPLAATRAHIEIFARELEATGRKLSTVAAKLNALAGFYKFAHADGIIDRNPMIHVMRPTIERESTTQGLTRPEFADMLKLAEATSLQDHALICLLGYNGLRVSEALNLDADHLGQHQGQTTIRIVRKGGKRQELVVNYRTAWAIHQLIESRGGVGPVFQSRMGNRMDRAGAARVVKRLAKAAGVTKNIHPHSLRHTFVTLCRDSDVPDRDIIAATGHADSRMIAYYDRGRNDLARNATHALAVFVERAG